MVVGENESEAVVMGMLMLVPSGQECALRSSSHDQIVRDAIIADVTVFSPISKILDTVYVLKSTETNYIVVFDGSELVGMLSRLQLEEYAAGQYARFSKLVLRDVMMPLPFRARIGDRLVTVREAMIQRRLSWLPILDEKDKLAGVLLAS